MLLRPGHRPALHTQGASSITLWIRRSCTTAGGQALGLLLSPEGEYVRGIVTNELAKGIDASWRLALDSAVDTLRSQLLAVLGVCLDPPHPIKPVEAACDSARHVSEVCSGSRTCA